MKVTVYEGHGIGKIILPFEFDREIQPCNSVRGKSWFALRWARASLKGGTMVFKVVDR
jgi:hypothetical protein